MKYELRINENSELVHKVRCDTLAQVRDLVRKLKLNVNYMRSKNKSRKFLFTVIKQGSGMYDLTIVRSFSY